MSAQPGDAQIAAAPGVFYAFKHPQAASAFLARRVRRHTARPRLPAGQAAFDRHRELLEPLIAFISDRGRLPATTELHDANDLINQLGSVKRAFAVIRRATGDERWDQLRHDRAQDLLVYLALTAFGGRPPFTSLDEALQLDIRTFFGSYRKACAEADRLLFSAGDPAGVDTACRTAEVGKLTPDALYIHTAGLDTLSPLLRVLEGCARTLVGTVERANIIKLGRLEPKVSYLAYPDFDSDPHPALTASVTAGLRSLRVDFRSYQDTPNPPILHRKELLVPPTYPHRERFARLTAQEERRGLYKHPQVIGTRHGWQVVLDAAQVCHRGHRLQRRPPTTGT